MTVNLFSDTGARRSDNTESPLTKFHSYNILTPEPLIILQQELG